MEGITIKLSNRKSEEFFHSALCNALGTGYMQGYGLDIKYNEEEYKKSRDSYKDKNNSSPCYEDVLMQMLKDGYSLTMVDNEMDGEYTRTIKLGDVWERVEKTPIRFLNDMIQGDDDAQTADVILQTVFFEDIIFG